ncbi:hypothetical protein Pmar_PMAR022246 [Perkinsus marinus ATCC 50983]|uniref:DNA replication complex GINS protein SLD5 C-terminal domain-containing protein n=1 Tax=Perkinsus marinus (strain ATCC 50983 / TXsc) TaxID=423536 RepID=C5KDK7_PERM5|nr:hypothetical protein Pmar_PMAR022246 [Perkinsus marinus ATCC 50983]EER17310.1 hypothetical protein Pmar_PMAR022246 [Perkinsus marinus ATCC 50983]|eukprot:XP_002785514.1 hypothetical protein Pmar_PMAR022246 [Perkinsus marinus ATCC 50983]
MGNMIRTPNIDTTTVVAKIVDDLSSDDMQLIKGRTYIVGYDVVKRYVEEGKVELV